ncbi:unnamed protein product [Didymodactylos carnosus]|uniref:Uncharacterized protein n=1 Tax=Didymodactylos carnosus TaxID=1234261 RepID=A0A814CCL5_9BILA|nr:unnamed protein product [Didymodactylos carnosus]CAF0938264.1 unnamed protein product [Didymodactylos carnosus]CAF3669645.1 unnamed protein product [Didymodactylos carnosus]CAF3715120.1 unnamed protein product [Didymodactylos carnosus]
MASIGGRALSLLRLRGGIYVPRFHAGTSSPPAHAGVTTPDGGTHTMNVNTTSKQQTLTTSGAIGARTTGGSPPSDMLLNLKASEKSNSTRPTEQFGRYGTSFDRFKERNSGSKPKSHKTIENSISYSMPMKLLLTGIVVTAIILAYKRFILDDPKVQEKLDYAKHKVNQEAH